LSHFQSLGELKESYKVRLSQLERRLDDLEKIIVMKRLKLINQRVLVLPVFELPQSGILLVKFEIMPSY
jgi:hypothetical protein